MTDKKQDTSLKSEGICLRTCPHPNEKCPSDAELRDFSLGKLSLNEADRIADTSDTCAECETFITQVESQSSDRLIDELLGSSGDVRFQNESELQQAIRQVESIPTSRADSSGQTVNLQGSNEETKSSDHVAQPVDVPMQFGEYVVTEVLGRGGMGVVYRGHHTRMKRDVAIKVLPVVTLKNQTSDDRFHREVEAAAKLLHPNIVTAFDAGQHGETTYLVMELVDGQDLGALLKEQGPLPIETAIDYIRQAARGLQYAHEQGVVHRDIKPSNLLVDSSGTIKILDLGLASIADGSDSQEQLTQSGQVMGTVDFMAPEQAKETHAATAQSDIYSLGCTLFRLLTGKPLYECDTIINKLLAHANNPIPKLTDIRQDVPPELYQVFQKMVAKHPHERQTTMALLIEELDACELETRTSMPRSEFTIVDTGPKDKVRHRKSASGKRTVQNAGETPVQTGRASSVFPRVALGLLGGGIALAAIIMCLPTKNGTIQIEINDPAIEVTVNENGYRIQGLEDDVEIKPGDHTLHVKRDDIVFDTEKFTVTKNNKVVVRVEYIDGTLRVVSSDRELGSRRAIMTITDTKANRNAARWVFSFGGYVHIITNEGEIQKLTNAKEIPAEPFQVQSISFTNIPQVADADFTPLRGLTELLTISFTNSNIGDAALENLKDCRKLEKINCIDCTQLTDAGLAHLTRLTNLQSLALDVTGISDAGMRHLAGLTNLKRISVGHTAVTGEGIASLEQCTAITTVSINSSQVTGDDLSKLSQFPELTSVYVDERQVTDIGTRHLASLPNLIRLNIKVSPNSQWTGEPLRSLTNVTQLVINTNGTDLHIQHAASMEKLTDLHFTQGSHVTDKGLAHLAKSPSLQVLLIASTTGQITDTGLQHLESLTSLRKLQLGSTKVTPEGLARFRAALPDCEVD